MHRDYPYLTKMKLLDENKMTREGKNFLEFFEVIRSSNILSESEIDRILEAEGGLNEIIEDGPVLLAYRALGKGAAEKSVPQLVKHLHDIEEKITSKCDNLFFYCEALIEEASDHKTKAQVVSLIKNIPKDYREHLMCRVQNK